MELTGDISFYRNIWLDFVLSCHVTNFFNKLNQSRFLWNDYGLINKLSFKFIIEQLCQTTHLVSPNNKKNQSSPKMN